MSGVDPFREMSVADVAKTYGVHRNTARAWMKEQEAAHGASVVYRRGGKMYTTYVVFAPHRSPSASVERHATSARRVTAEIVTHNLKIDELERRLDAATARNIEFQRQAASWFERVRKLEAALARTR